MKNHPILIAVTLALYLSISGCSYLDQSYDATLGVVDRAMLPNIWLNGADTGRPVASGIGVNDALVVSLGADVARLWDLRIAQFNGASVGAAITQATMGAAIAGVAIGQGPVAAAGGIAAASLFLQHIFGIANTPAKANAYLGGKELLVAAENEYWLSLQIDNCHNTIIPGNQLTPAGATYWTQISNAELVVQKQLQMTMPTLDQLQAATATPTKIMRERLASGCTAGTNVIGPR